MSAPTIRSSVLLRSEQTADQVSAIEITVAAGWAGPPLHHHDFDEAFYIVDGHRLLPTKPQPPLRP